MDGNVSFSVTLSHHLYVKIRHFGKSTVKEVRFLPCRHRAASHAAPHYHMHATFSDSEAVLKKSLYKYIGMYERETQVFCLVSVRIDVQNNCTGSYRILFC